MVKRYEILESLPAYGPMHIPITQDGVPFYSEGFVVRFIKADGTEWVANFKPGWTDLKQVIELENSTNLLVIAFGTCYLMNANDTKPISAFGVGYSDVLKADNKRLVLVDQTDLTIIERDGTHWNTERISWDGFAEVTVKGVLVTGLAYSPTHKADEWVKFSYDLDTKILAGGGYFTYENVKPWWKLW